MGVAAFPLKRVLQSDSLSSSASLQIKLAEHSKHSESSRSSLLHHTSGPSIDGQSSGSVCGPLLVSYFIMVMHDLHPRRPRGSLRGCEKIWAKKSQERGEEPLFSSFLTFLRLNFFLPILAVPGSPRMA